MNAKELVGRIAIRTKPVTYPSGTVDRSHSTTPIKILKATDDHIVYQFTDVDLKILGAEPRILSWPWNDDNWTDYDELMANIVIDEFPEVEQ